MSRDHWAAEAQNERCPPPQPVFTQALMRPTASCGQSSNFLGAHDMLPNSILKLWALRWLLVVGCPSFSTSPSLFLHHIRHLANLMSIVNSRLVENLHPFGRRRSAGSQQLANALGDDRIRTSAREPSWRLSMRTKLVRVMQLNRWQTHKRTAASPCPVTMLYLFLTDRSGQPALHVSPLRQGDILWPRTLLTATWAAQPDHPTSSNCLSSGL